MINDFLYVLENYPNADLSKKEDRELIANALVNIMCSHHIISYTDLDAVRKDPAMITWIEQCKTRNEEEDNQMELPLERGL
tara:strand:+ start:687 stop:929 length:243 start_codon:yes stop_codon:yes gene_type:complete